MELFKKVKCTGFLKRVHDGKGLTVDPNSGTAYEIGSDSPTDIDSMKKTMYEFIKKPFTGFVVGTKEIVAEYLLTVQGGEEYHAYMDGHTYEDRAGYRIDFQSTKVEKCAIVYYANNKSHLVPVDRIEQENE